jgi:hypothetical protein
MAGKIAYLNRLYSRTRFRSTEYKEHISGSSPPSVFIGKYGYPKVFVGPMIPPVQGDTSIMDFPEEWLSIGKNAWDIINFRFSLVRGKQAINIKDKGKTVEVLQQIALAKKSLGIDAEFYRKPRGAFLHEHMQPFGPSAPLKSMEVSNEKFDLQLEKAYYDTDLFAKDAIVSLYNKSLPVSTIQKALSVGAFGLEANRKMVPTRWSITAVDSTLSSHILAEIRSYPVIDCYQVYEYGAMNTSFLILLTPTGWQYEMLEAFIRVLGTEVMVFSDWEPYAGRKDYASIGGCYYSGKLAVAEKLYEMKRQAGAIVFRESCHGYIPLGVWLVRQCMRSALERKPMEFEDFPSAISYVSSRLRLPISNFRRSSVLIKQSNIAQFCR